MQAQNTVQERSGGLPLEQRRQLTKRAQRIWTAGDFARVGIRRVFAFDVLIRAAEIHAGERVLDLAAGSGNTAIASACRGARVTASDFVPSLLDVAATRAEAEALALDTVVADDLLAAGPVQTGWRRHAPRRRRVPAGRGGALMKTLLALAPLLTAATLATTAQAASSPKPCGAVSGPTAHVAGITVNHYAIYRVGSTCVFSRHTVTSILKQHLPNSSTPVRAKSPSGWICVAQEVVSYVAVDGHCQRGRSSVFPWAGIGLHP
jgi:SAM-dependent methyltransferase